MENNIEYLYLIIIILFLHILYKYNKKEFLKIIKKRYKTN